jgi:hypothetical protein
MVMIFVLTVRPQNQLLQEDVVGEEVNLQDDRNNCRTSFHRRLTRMDARHMNLYVQGMTMRLNMILKLMKIVNRVAIRMALKDITVMTGDTEMLQGEIMTEVIE